MTIVKKLMSKLTHLITSQLLIRFEKNEKLIVSQLEQLKINQGVIMANQNIYLKSLDILTDIKKSEFKVFSQWGDDGIIQFLINYLEIQENSFVEFGVETYNECNTKFLLLNNNWRGLIFDGSDENINIVKKNELFWKYNLTAKSEFITAENINNLLQENGFIGDIGLLHIDIDGNDYWVWKSIKVINPVIVIVEYNSLFGPSNPWTIPYQSDFIRSNSHFSNLYYGSSLTSLFDLGKEKGYSFIGCNSNGNNAYFVREDKLKGLSTMTPELGYVKSEFSESRDEQGSLSFLRNDDRLNQLKNLIVFNTRKNETEKIK
jgi:hypothetical protein